LPQPTMAPVFAAGPVPQWIALLHMDNKLVVLNLMT